MTKKEQTRRLIEYMILLIVFTLMIIYLKKR
jgi:hypothetical protein